MLAGARQGRSGRLRRFAGAMLARHLQAVAVPGPDVFGASGLDPSALGVRYAATPRHAQLLMLAGPLPADLREAAAVAYAQMPRPRVILALAAEGLSPLPDADVTGPASREGLAEGLRRVRELLAHRAFAPETHAFEPALLGTRTEYTCPMHPEIVRDEPGTCPKCGMDLVPREAAGPAGSPGHDRSHAHAHGHSHDPGTDDGEDHQHGAGTNFMSMVEVTRELPRGRDGLPMDRIDVPFGPLFPGLPGGLLLTLTLAGDAVARASARTAMGQRSALPEPGMPAERFIEHLGALDPLAPAAYRLLARRALEAASGSTPSPEQQRARVAAAERERAASHLGWLAQLARQIDLPWLDRRATRLQHALIHGEHAALAPLARQLEGLRARLERTPLLRARLERVGALPPGDGLRGPVARAAGMSSDARTRDPAYRGLGFEAVLRQGGDALTRLHVRLEELTRSLQLAEAAGAVTLPAASDTAAAGIGDASGDGDAAVETPRGEARLHVHLDDGLVTGARLETPSARHLAVLPELLVDLEVGDALVATGSLDISPWEASAS